jgi:signal transduction histidine kinase
MSTGEMARTRGTRHAASAKAGRDAGDAAVAALEAFDLGAALVDLTLGRVTWRSPGFAAQCLVDADDDATRLEGRLPGLHEALASLARQRGVHHGGDAVAVASRVCWSTAGDGRALVAEACLARPGVAALRLREAAPDAEDPAHAQALRRHLEDRERLLFTSRSLAVGEMASTLAHELNQPIGTVVNVLRGLRLRLERLDSGGELLAGVQVALDQALFAARVIARIREYTQSRQPRRAALDLADVARESLALMDWEIRRDGVSVRCELPDAPLHVLGDEVMLQQVVANLLRNALDAMRDNPRDAQGRAERRLHLRLAVERRMAVLSVHDNGCGLPPGSEDQVFVPFQSSKPNGMGLGLKICRSFVETHQGRLWFTPSEPGRRGCAFHVALPLLPPDEIDARSQAR